MQDTLAFGVFCEFGQQESWKQKKRILKRILFERAEDGAQTRDPQLGRLMLYQLSYFRNLSGQRWIRTTEGVSQQIYSLPHLATLVFAQHIN